jgi:hypothetical protein
MSVRIHELAKRIAWTTRSCSPCLRSAVSTLNRLQHCRSHHADALESELKGAHTAAAESPAVEAESAPVGDEAAPASRRAAARRIRALGRRDCRGKGRGREGQTGRSRRCGSSTAAPGHACAGAPCTRSGASASAAAGFPSGTVGPASGRTAASRLSRADGSSASGPARCRTGPCAHAASSGRAAGSCSSCCGCCAKPASPAPWRRPRPRPSPLFFRLRTCRLRWRCRPSQARFRAAHTAAAPFAGPVATSSSRDIKILHASRRSRRDFATAIA